MSKHAADFLKSIGMTVEVTPKDEESLGWVDTGSYMLNALCSGSIYGGIPDNRIAMFGGEPSAGKTFFTLSILKNFLDDNPGSYGILYETENATDRDTLISRGIDPARVRIEKPATLEDFRCHSIKLLTAYLGCSEKQRPRLMLVMDSLSALFTTKELKEAIENSGTRDMTKAGIIRSTFHILTNTYLAKAKVPMIVTNHVYNSMNPYGDPMVFSGGLGALYAATTALTLTKKKDRDAKTKDIVGALITATAKKSRLGKENAKAEIRLNYKTGLDRHYGLLDLAVKHGIVTKAGAYLVMPDGSKHYESAIYADTDRFFTPDFMERLDEAAGVEFKYGDYSDAGLPDNSGGMEGTEATKVYPNTD
jgi:RecA/RadA recombinase